MRTRKTRKEVKTRSYRIHEEIKRCEYGGKKNDPYFQRKVDKLYGELNGLV